MFVIRGLVSVELLTLRLVDSDTGKCGNPKAVSDGVACWSHLQCANSGWSVSLCKITQQKIECSSFHLSTKTYTARRISFQTKKITQQSTRVLESKNNVWWSKFVSRNDHMHVHLSAHIRNYSRIIQLHVTKRVIETQQRLLSAWSKRGYIAWVTNARKWGIESQIRLRQKEVTMPVSFHNIITNQQRNKQCWWRKLVSGQLLGRKVISKPRWRLSFSHRLEKMPLDKRMRTWDDLKALGRKIEFSVIVEHPWGVVYGRA